VEGEDCRSCLGQRRQTGVNDGRRVKTRRGVLIRRAPVSAEGGKGGLGNLSTRGWGGQDGETEQKEEGPKKR